jgi:hypothetical protein
MHWLRAWRCALALALLLPASLRAESPSLEYAVEAAFVLKFAPFVGWPDGFPSGDNRPLTVCLFGDDPVNAQITAAARAPSQGFMPVIVRPVDNATDAAGCRMLYVGEADGTQAADLLAALSGHSVLTITSLERNQSVHGVISFVLERNHVRFDIDLAQAIRNRLSISSKLLALARNVSRPEGP